MNNSCSIRVPGNNSCSKQKQIVPQKNESRFDEPIHEHWWRGKRKERAEKTNNFEPFFSNSTLTFLTFGNTFRLPILPTRHIILLCLPLIKIWGRQRKTARRIGKIGRRKVFSKVKNVNVESLKKRSKLLDFSARSFLFPLHQCSWMGSSKRLSFFGGHELFWLGRHELILFELELFTNCSELTRQLMGINGETFLPRSAPK